MSRKDFQNVAAHAKRATRKGGIIAFVLLRDQVLHDTALIVLFADLQILCHRAVGLDRTDTIDARDGGDDDHVIPFKQSARRRVAHTVDLFVDLAFFFDESVRTGDVSFGLIVVIKADEILDGVVWKEAFELAIKLCCEGFVRGENDRRALRLLDHFRHRKGFARSRGT